MLVAVGVPVLVTVGVGVDVDVAVAVGVGVCGIGRLKECWTKLPVPAELYAKTTAV